jgi:hypothetical protein
MYTFIIKKTHGLQKLIKIFVIKLMKLTGLLTGIQDFLG